MLVLVYMSKHLKDLKYQLLYEVMQGINGVILKQLPINICGLKQLFYLWLITGIIVIPMHGIKQITQIVIG